MIQVYKIIFFGYTKILQSGEMLLEVRKAMCVKARVLHKKSVGNKKNKHCYKFFSSLASILPNVDRS